MSSSRLPSFSASPHRHEVDNVDDKDAARRAMQWWRQRYRSSAFARRATGFRLLLRSCWRNSCSLLQEGSIVAAVFQLASSAMGAGCLSLPYMVKTSGIAEGFFMLCFGAVLSQASLVALMLCARQTQSESMASLLALAGLGGRGGRICDAAVAAYGICAVVCCLIFIGDFFSGITASPFLGLDIRREVLIAVLAAGVVWPLSVPRHSAALRYAGALSVMAIALTAIAVVCKVPSYSAATVTAAALEHVQGSHAAPAVEPLRWWTGDVRVALRSFCISLFAFAAHTNAVPVVNALQGAGVSSIKRAIFFSACIELGIYILIGFGGYLSFRGATKQDFIVNYRNDDTVMFFIRCIFGAAVCLSAPINLRPAVASLLGLLASATAKQKSISVHGLRGESEHVVRFALVTGVIGACAVVAMYSEDVANVISLVGSSLCTLITLVWPAAVYCKVLAPSHPRILATGVLFALYAGSALGFAAFVLQLLDNVKA